MLFSGRPAGSWLFFKGRSSCSNTRESSRREFVALNPFPLFSVCNCCTSPSGTLQSLGEFFSENQAEQADFG